MGRPLLPRSRREIHDTLLALGTRPRRGRGQNFLADASALDRIAAAAAPGPGDFVLEVGPGLGGLTGRLLATGADVLAVEIDAAIVEAAAADLEAYLGGGQRPR